MRVYLVRHGESIAQGMDDHRSLTEQGSREIACLAKLIAKLNLKISKIFHSKKLRAKQTAEILAKGILFKGELEVHLGLQPMDSIIPLVNEIENLDQESLFVGHLPFMQKLVAKLVSGDEECPLVTFYTGTMVCLEKTRDYTWSIQWMLSPELLNMKE